MDGGKKPQHMNSASSTLIFLFIILFVVFKGSEFLPLDAQLLVILPINSTLQWFSEEVKKMKFTEIDALL